VLAALRAAVRAAVLAAGWFEYVEDYIATTPITEYDAEGKHIVDPFTYSLKFYKPSQSSY
jgi:hypothetical protein